MKPGKLYFVRHATSRFNIVNAEWIATHSPSEEKAFKWDPKYFDVQLAEKGVEEARAARDTAARLEIDLIVVSPLRRALQTCEILFGDSGVPVKVCPLFSELCVNSPDLSEFTDTPFPEFARYDWGEMLGRETYWLLDNVRNRHTARIRAGARSMAEARERMLQTMREITPELLESQEDVGVRIDLAKEYLLAHLSAGRNLAVVTHSYFVRDFTTRVVGTAKFLANCEIWECPLVSKS